MATTQDKSKRLRSLRSRATANRRWALASPPERKAATVAAQEGYWLKLEQEVDPEGVLSPEDRRVRAMQLWRSKMDTAKANRLSKGRAA